MAFTGPLRLKANFKIGTSVAASFDVSDQITGVTISASRNELVVPPTGSTDETVAAGSTKWTAKLDYLSNDVGTTTDLTRVFYTALADPNGTLYLSGTMRAGAASSVNPRWFGSILVGGLGMGGSQETLAQDSQSFRMLGAPSIASS